MIGILVGIILFLILWIIVGIIRYEDNEVEVKISVYSFYTIFIHGPFWWMMFFTECMEKLMDKIRIEDFFNKIFILKRKI
jgi:hypothetical protein